jgi:predicted DNA-binding transcriptional regulator AlpA
MKLREFANQVGVSYATALRLFRKGEIPGAYKLPTGTIVIPETAIQQMSDSTMSLHDFCCLIENLAKQKLKESDYRHVTDVMSISSHKVHK